MKLSKQLIATLLAGGLLFGMTCAQAANKVEATANVALTSDYVWRGVSQTNEDPAIQGGFDLSFGPGLYAGVWGSNVDFGDVENLELDLYGGWQTEFGSGVGLDIGFIHYHYFADNNDVDFNELYLGLSYGGLSAKVSYDPDNKNTYLEAGYEYEFKDIATVSAHIGTYMFDNDFAPGTDSYVDWSLGVSKEIGGFGFALTYYDTNGDGAAFGGKNADSRVVLTISKDL